MISEIKFRDRHEILHGLKLNFTREGGEPYKTIILAGENGCGKTRIFESLANFIDNKQRNKNVLLPFLRIKYNINDKIYEITPASDNRALHGDHIGYIKGINNNVSKKITEMPRAGNELLVRTVNNGEPKVGKTDRDEEDIRNYGFASIPAHTTLHSQKVTHIGTNTLDQSNRANNTSATDIKQLLVDIFARDALSMYTEFEKSFHDSSKKHQRGEDATTQISKHIFDIGFYRISRFKNAFNEFFEKDSKLKFHSCKIVNNNEYTIFFEKNGSIFPIDELSTGEKQVVFLGATILKNKRMMSGGLVLVDEPELSMHPKWQKRILEYYQDLTSVDKVDENGNRIKNEKGEIEKEQTAQLIVATHSPYIIEAAMTGKNKDDTLIIILKENNGKVEPKYIGDTDFVLETTTAAEVNYIAFDIPSVDYHQQLYAYLQYLTDTEESVTKCDKEIERSPHYDKSIHSKDSNYRNAKYNTLPTYIRNAVNHPYCTDESGEKTKKKYTEDELRTSIELLREIIKDEQTKQQTKS